MFQPPLSYALIFRNPEFSQSLADKLSQLGVHSVVFSPSSLDKVQRNQIVLLDLHYVGDYLACEGISALDKIRIVSGNQEPILVYSCLTIAQIKKYSRKRPSTIDRLFLAREKIFFNLYPVDLQDIIAFFATSKTKLHE